MESLITVIGLIASIASLVLAVVAIWLAVVFYRLSRDESEASAQNAQEISTSISRLEKVFDSLYSDTFSIMKDTVTDMRHHIWRREDVSSEVSAEVADGDKEVSANGEPILKRLEEFSAQLGIADDKIEALRRMLTPVVEESAEISPGKSEGDIKQRVLLLLLSRGPHRPIPLLQIVRVLSPDEGVPTSRNRFNAYHEVASAVFALREEGKVTWDGDETVLRSDSRVRVVRRDGKPQDT